MEKLLTTEERIRRAEDTYRRRAAGIRVPTNITSNKKDFKLFKKMGIQILICICIYSGFYIIKENEEIFSEDVRNKVKEVLSYDIDFQGFYDTSMQYINNFIGENEENKEENSLNENNVILQGIEGIIGEGASTTVESNEEDIQNEFIEDTLAASEILLPQEESSFNQLSTDAKYIKDNYSFRLPLKGTITSRFGVRTPTTETVPKYHTGIDIAVNTGTKFIAAMEGEVTLVSSYGDFGNHFIITNGEVSTLYAHCSKIYVKQGDKVTQGQEIGEVGSTGNSTGPHLHFQIEVEGRLVNPEGILEF